MKTNQSRYIAGLYMRLSKDDDKGGESSSITTQRKMLLSYAKENKFIVYNEYVDDGWSGTNFDRPEFKRMIQDIEDKKINLIITKDLSRLGRDYITAGQYTEIYFPSKGVRYIAINDGYDSDSPFDDIVPFKNVINEMYARDTSKKIRSAFITKMKDGHYIGNFAPFGYKKDPDNKNHLIPDMESTPIVRRIFDMACKGDKPSEIVECLNSENVITPMMYRCQNNPKLDIDQYSKRKQWTTSSVCRILHNAVYIGNMAQRKTTKVSFKSTATITNPKEDWIVVENTHEPIIDNETFDIARRISLSRTNPKNKGFVNIFSGIAKCPDCGRNMSTTGTRKKGSPANLVCCGYKTYDSKECSNHFIDYNILYDIVLKAIREQTKLSDIEKQELVSELESEAKNNSENDIVNQELNRLERRRAELDNIIEKLYEDNYQGVINDDRFRKLLEKYELENKTISGKMESSFQKMSEKKDGVSAKKMHEQFLSLVEQYTDLKELTKDIVFKLIDRIEIFQGHFEKTENGKVKQQKIKIYFRCIGIPITKEYTA